MQRVSCIDIPDLPLQLLLRAHLDWRDAPVAVVAEERPEAPLLLINRHARELRLRTGMRFGAAKSLLPELRAGSVSALEVEQAAGQLVRDLQTFSPHVERDPVSAGVFYVDPSGLSHLYGGELSWARAVHRYLSGRSFYTSIVVAHGRALSYALSRVTRGVRVIETAEETLALARAVQLDAPANHAQAARLPGAARPLHPGRPGRGRGRPAGVTLWERGGAPRARRARRRDAAAVRRAAHGHPAQPSWRSILPTTTWRASALLSSVCSTCCSRTCASADRAYARCGCASRCCARRPPCSGSSPRRPPVTPSCCWSCCACGCPPWRSIRQ